MTESTHPPGVMISSTFYDLRQVREDLRHFLEDELGYRPLLSEHPSFPLNPDANTIDNCRERVERDADILVLVIGGRYGTIDDQTSKSVTNLEYLAARQKGIPVYAFIEQGIVSLIPIWKSNPTADFSGRVDTAKLFEFIEQVRSTHKVWMQEFKHASDIIDALRIQFAYEHRRGLLLHKAVRQAGDQYWLNALSGKTLRIALEKPAGWEYLLFAHALIDAVNKHHYLKRRHEAGIPLGLGEDVNDPIPWFRARLSDAMRMSQGLNALVNDTLQDALGPSGIAADAEKIIFVADTIGDLYGDALRWHARITAANIDERFRQLSSVLSRMVNDLIQQIGGFGVTVRDTFEHAIAAASSGTSQVVNVTLTIAIPASVLDEFNSEFSRLQAELV
jgi:uncharacterized protein DUF4062